MSLEEGESRKHKLSSSWTLWHFATPKGYEPKNYGDFLRKVYTFDNVEDFWCVFNHISKPSALPVNGAMMMFRNNIPPEWEDEKNKDGGEWRVSFPQQPYSKSIDSFWENLLMHSIGEMFTDSDEVLGAYLKIRQKNKNNQEYRLSVWTASSNDENHDRLLKLGHQLRESFGCPPDFVPSLEFRAHADSYNRSKNPRIKIDGRGKGSRSGDPRNRHSGRGNDRRQESRSGGSYGNRNFSESRGGAGGSSRGGGTNRSSRSGERNGSGPSRPRTSTRT